MKLSNVIAIAALVISLVSIYYSWNIDRRAKYSQCVDDVKEYPQELYRLGMEYSKYLNRYLVIKSSKNLQGLKRSTREYVNYLDGVNGSLSKYSCSTSFLGEVKELVDFVVSTTNDAINHRNVEITSVVKALDKVSKFRYRLECCEKCL